MSVKRAANQEMQDVLKVYALLITVLIYEGFTCKIAYYHSKADLTRVQKVLYVF